MDGTFAFSAGYTPGGALYGVIWEDVGIDSDLPFDEKVRLYKKQMDGASEALEIDDDDKLLFDKGWLNQRDAVGEKKLASNVKDMPAIAKAEEYMRRFLMDKAENDLDSYLNDF